MIKVIVASGNPVKQEATRTAFKKTFNQQIIIEGAHVPSGVSDQPMTDEETLRGAINRAEAAKKLVSEADYWVGIEGGVATYKHGMEAFGWMVVLSSGKRSQARSASFILPPAIAASLVQGGELGPAMDVLFKENNSKHKGGAVGLLTNGQVTRTALYEQPLLMALIPFLHTDKY